jgi:sugar phosphate isomerase/epimerase
MSDQSVRFGLPFLLETQNASEAAALCHEHGLHFVELNTNFPPSLLHVLDVEQLLALREQYGCFFTLHLDDSLDPFNPNPRVRKASVDTVLDAIALAKAAHMPIINLHMPRGNIVTLPDGKHYIFNEYPDDFHAALTDFRTACEQAVGIAPVTLCIENTDGWEPYEHAAIELLLSSPVFGLTLDIGHDHATGNRDLPFVLSHQQRLKHMHAHDGRGTTNHQALGAGEIPIAQRLTLAAQCNATVVLETKTKAALAQSVNYLKCEGGL